MEKYKSLRHRSAAMQGGNSPHLLRRFANARPESSMAAVNRGAQMDENSRFLMVYHRGYWEDLYYKNGEISHILVSVYPTITYDGLLESIHCVVQADMHEWGYQVEAPCGYKDKIVKWKLNTDSDVTQFLNMYKDKEFVVCVSLKKVNNGGCNTINEGILTRDFEHSPNQNSHVPTRYVGPIAPRTYTPVNSVFYDHKFGSSSKDHISEFGSSNIWDSYYNSNIDDEDESQDGHELLHEQSNKEHQLVHALSILYQDGASTFSKLPEYLYYLKQANIGSHTDLLVDDNNVFKYAFFALGASITGFLTYAMPVIVIDGTHLKGEYCGILFVALTQDGNGHIFPLAIGIGDVECTESWTLFLRRLRKAYEFPQELLFVSDQRQSILHSFRNVYPEAKYDICCHHLHQKIVAFGHYVIKRFNDVAYTYRGSEFLSCMESLQRMDETGLLIDMLNTSDPENWARICWKVKRYEFMTFNIVESWKKILFRTRDLPIVAILEFVRLIIEEWFINQHNEAATNKQILCKEVPKKMVELERLANKLVVTNLSSNIFKVSVVSGSFNVDLMLRTCDCGEFDLSLMPCIHAVAAIRFANCNISDFVSSYFHAEHVRKMWACTVKSIPHPDHWVIPEWLNSISCNPPTLPTQADRPQQNRR